MQGKKEPRIEFLRATYENDRNGKGLRTKTLEYGIQMEFTAEIDEVFKVAENFIREELQLPQIAREINGYEDKSCYTDLQVIQNGLYTSSFPWEMCFTTRYPFPAITDAEYQRFLQRQTERTSKRVSGNSEPASKGQ